MDKLMEQMATKVSLPDCVFIDDALRNYAAFIRDGTIPYPQEHGEFLATKCDEVRVRIRPKQKVEAGEAGDDAAPLKSSPIAQPPMREGR